ncbi:MAG: redoxin domain-containing protein [Gammaproteobacteria bacterium]|nr:redoxin domain-containing protein [Gammaproteobacteria bacterium]
MKRGIIYSLFSIVAIAGSLKILPPANGETFSTPYPAAEFSHTTDNEWLNSQPLTLNKLRGKVLLIDFWTFDCWNCYRTFPWRKAMEARLEPKGLQIIGVHTPEFDHEKIRKNIVSKVAEFGLHHPIMIDNDFSYWQAMHNRYWPAYYIIDKQGQIRAVYYGETHEDDRQARQIESLITSLLNE